MAVVWVDIAPAGGTGSPILLARSSTQNLTETGTPAANDGIPLAGLGWVEPIIIAPANQTFTGAGFGRGWRIGDPVFFPAAAWDRVQQADTVLSDRVGNKIIYLPPIRVGNPAGRFSFQADSIGLSGGTQVTIILNGYPPSLVRPR